jgi:hypothetical protein
MCLPAITDVLAARQHDAVTQSYRAQLLDQGTAGGKAKLRAQGIYRRAAHLRAESVHPVDENQVRRYSPALAHYYNSEGLPRAMPTAHSLHPPQLPRTVSGHVGQ